MKLLLLIAAALCLVLYWVFGLLHWPGRLYLVIGSLLLFAISTFVGYEKKKRNTDTLDDEFLDDV